MQISEFKADPVPRLWSTLYRIQTVLGQSTRQMAEMMRLKEEEFKSMSAQVIEPSAFSTMELAKAIKISFDAIMLEEIDYIALEQQFHGNNQHLPERYQVGAKSRRSTVRGVLNYVEQSYGWERRAQILRRFQVTESALLNDADLINFGLTVDIGNWLVRFHQSEDVLMGMGRASLLSTQNSDFSVELKRSRNLLELFEAIFSGIIEKHFEKNFQWEIVKINSNTITIRGFPNVDVFEEIDDQYSKNSNICSVRKGVLSAMPQYLDYPYADIRKTACVCHGAGFCEYEIDLNSSIRLKDHHRLSCV